MGGVRLAVDAPDLIFGSRVSSNKTSTIYYSLLTFLISPFLTTILHFKQYYLQFQLRSNPDDEMLTSYRDKLRDYSFQFTKLELGLETVLQFIGQLILYFLSHTDTQTIEVVSVQKIEVNETLLVLSLIASFIGCLFSYLTGLSRKRAYFPFISKIMAVFYFTPALIVKVWCIIMYFTPSLGLFNVLQHWKNEQVLWNTDSLQEFIVDGMIVLEHDKGSIRVPWTPVTSIKGPEYILYTTLRLKEYFRAFWIIFFVQAIIIYSIKHKWCKSTFNKKTFIDRIIHSMENVLIVSNTEEWDSEKGDPEEHKQRLKTNKNEMNRLMIMNFIFNCIYLTPLIFLGRYESCNSYLQKF